MAQDKNGRLGRESKAYFTIRMQAGIQLHALGKG